MPAHPAAGAAGPPRHLPPRSGVPGFSSRVLAPQQAHQGHEPQLAHVLPAAIKLGDDRVGHRPSVTVPALTPVADTLNCRWSPALAAFASASPIAARSARPTPRPPFPPSSPTPSG